MTIIQKIGLALAFLMVVAAAFVWLRIRDKRQAELNAKIHDANYVARPPK